MNASHRFSTFLVDETTLVFAFRYALNRGTTAPWHVCAQLKTHWTNLNDWTQEQIQREIQQAIDLKIVAEHCEGNWREILALPVKKGVNYS